MSLHQIFSDLGPNMNNFLLWPAQQICRFLLRLPQTSDWMWQRVPKVRRWFARKVGDKRFCLSFDGDTRMWVSLTDHIESQIFWQGSQEADRGEVKLLKSLLRPNYVFLDVGANVGVFTLIAAKRLSQGCVHAFEPAISHLDRLDANLALNRFRNVVVHPVALSNSTRQANLYFPKAHGSMLNTGMASQFQAEASDDRVEEIRCVKLDDYVLEQNIPEPDILKIDVEGAEMDVLEGAVEVIRKSRPHVVMEVNIHLLTRANRTVTEIFDYWNHLGYRLFRIGDDAELLPIASPADLLEPQNIYCSPPLVQTS